MLFFFFVKLIPLFANIAKSILFNRNEYVDIYFETGVRSKGKDFSYIKHYSVHRVPTIEMNSLTKEKKDRTKNQISLF